MSKRLPYDQWLKSLTKDELAAYYQRRLKAQGNKGRSTVRGRGAYTAAPKKKATTKRKSTVRKVPNRGANQNFNSDYGARLGAVVGEGLQSFANALGFGDYTIEQNSCLSMIDMGTSPPRVRNSKSGEATIIQHREYICDIMSGPNTPTDFKIESFNINPGNTAMFPFLASIAKNFQEYELRGMLMEMKSLSSDYASSLSMGSMFCATDYNVLNAPPVSKQQIENMEYACSDKPSKSIIMPIECARKNSPQTHLYVAVDGEYNGGDARLYDFGKFYYGSSGIPTANTPIAELWATYEVACFKPMINQAGEASSKPGYAMYNLLTPQYSNPLGANQQLVGYAEDSAWEGSINSTGFTLPTSPYEQLYSIAWYIYGPNAVGCSKPTITPSAGVTIPYLYYLSGSQFVYTTGTATQFFCLFSVLVPAGMENATIGFGTDGTYPNGTGTSGNLVINTSIPFGL